MRRSVVLTLVALVAAVALVIVAAVWVIGGLNDGDDASSESTPTDEKAPSGLEDFYSQVVRWDSCDGKALCATAEVPVDYDDPDGETLELALRKFEATGKKKGTIFVNPGGPGGSAQDFADLMVTRFPAEVREQYDIVGADPRGIGESTPLQCLDDENFDEFIALDPDPETPQELEQSRDGIVAMGEACEKGSGELAAHVSTEEAARDHDVLRAALGEEQLNWLGASYGTQLGATYADLFPDKVGRMVLDGGIDPSLGSVETSLGQAQGFQRALEAYVDDCVGGGECPLGSSREAALDRITGFMQALDERPMTMSGRELTEGLAFYGVAVTLYAKESWPYLTSAFDKALNEDDPQLFLQLADIYFDRNADGEFLSNSGQAIFAVNCLDGPVDLSVEEVENDVLPRFREASPVFGGALGWGVLSCADWPIDSSAEQQPVTADGADPILVVGTTRDPATPYEWSQALAEQLTSGVLVTREGDGHTGYRMGNPCVDEVVDAYLLDGKVPEDGALCKE